MKLNNARTSTCSSRLKKKNAWTLNVHRFCSAVRSVLPCVVVSLLATSEKCKNKNKTKEKWLKWGVFFVRPGGAASLRSPPPQLPLPLVHSFALYFRDIFKETNKQQNIWLTRLPKKTINHTATVAAQSWYHYIMVEWNGFTGFARLIVKNKVLFSWLFHLLILWLED